MRHFLSLALLSGAALALLASEVAAQERGAAEEEPALGFGSGAGFVRVGFAALWSGEFKGEGLDTAILHGEERERVKVPLEIVSEEGGPSLLGVSLELVGGWEGLLVGLNVDLFWMFGAPVAVRISTPAGESSEAVPELVAGVDGALSGYLRMDGGGFVGYRTRAGRAGFFVQAGLGLGFSVMELAFQVNGADNAVSPVDVALVVPMKLGMDFLLIKNVFYYAELNYTVSFAATYGFSSGVGLRY